MSRLFACVVFVTLQAGAGPSCERYTQIKFTNELKHFVTHYLNRRRQRIAAGNERVRGGVHLPKPQVMMLVEWDRELALLAQRLADQCNFVHDDCRATVKFPYAGQTVGEVRWRRFSDSDELSAQRAIRRVLDAWWGERRRVQPQQLIAPFRLAAKGTLWGHFSQLAVWNLQAVGCGAVRHGARHPRLLLVCDFSHTNMLGQRTLVPGPMAPCPIHTARRLRSAYPALCGPVRHPAPHEVEEDREEYEEDEEPVESETVEVGDVPTPSIWIKRRNQEKRPVSLERPTKSLHTTVISPVTIREFPEEATRKLGNEMFKMTPPEAEVREADTREARAREAEARAREAEAREARAREVKAREMESRIKAQFKKEKFFNRIVQTNWPSMKTFQGPSKQWHQTQEVPNPETNREQVIPLSAPPQPRRQSVKSPDLRMIGMYRPTVRKDTTEHTEMESAYHHRWKQTRIRPQRPGANALFITTPLNTSKKAAVALINLDKEDIDQVFRDTGFKLSWKTTP